MAFTNQTTHYGLPLPVGGDKSTFLDTNQAFEAVDSALYEAYTDANGAAADIADLQLDVNQLQVSMLGAQNDIDLLQSRQTITETNVTSLLSDMGTAQTDISKLQIDLTADELRVSTLEATVSSLTPESVTVTALSTDTYGSFASKIAAALDHSKVTSSTTACSPGNNYIFRISRNVSNDHRFTATEYHSLGEILADSGRWFNNVYSGTAWTSSEMTAETMTGGMLGDWTINYV